MALSMVLSMALSLLGASITVSAASAPSLTGLLLERYKNTQALGTPDDTTKNRAGASVDLGGLDGALSLRLQGMWTPENSGEYVLHCGCAELDHLYLWIDDHMMCDTQSWVGWQGPAQGPASVPLTADKPVYFRAHLHRALSRPLVPVTLNISLNISGALQPIPATELSPAIPQLQVQRMDLQRGLLNGWNSWWSTIGAKPGYRGGMLAV